MQYAEVKGLGRSCSRLVLGTMAFNLERIDHWFRLLDRFSEMGGNCLDTAVTYYHGQSEQVIGRWRKNRGVGEEMLLITKGAHPHGDGLSRVRPECIEEDLSVSLDRLQVDAIDIYMLHRDDESVPVGELVDVLHRQVEAGRIRCFGGSNWTPARLAAANAYARQHGLTPFTVSSPNLSLAQPNMPRWPGCVSVTTEDLAWYEEHNMPIFSWSAQASGFFSGRFSPDRPDDPEMVRVYYSEENWARYDRARQLARQKGVTAHHIALAYVLSQPFPTFALVGPLTEEELKASMEAVGLELSAEEVTWLDGRRREKPASLG